MCLWRAGVSICGVAFQELQHLVHDVQPIEMPGGSSQLDGGSGEA